jgi:PhzF family phenazine biosynthesis protein
MARYRIKQVDAFTTEPLKGNPAGVVADARGLDGGTMQRVAREMNLSETTFVFPPSHPGADYHIRFFTPGSELPLAGHPTIATLHALLEDRRFGDRGERFSVQQQTGAGVLPVEVDMTTSPHPTLLMTQAAATLDDARTDPQALAAALGLAVEDLLATPLQRVNVGISWLIGGVRDLATIASLQPDMGALARIELDEGMGITVFAPEASDPQCSIRVRSFAPADGIPEDPVCGSGNGCVAVYMAAQGVLDGPRAYKAEQGIESGRDGRVNVRLLKEDGIFTPQIGGQAVTVLEGELRLPDSPK